MERARAMALLLWLLIVVLALGGCSPEKAAELLGEEEEREQRDIVRPSPEDPEYGAYILIPDYWGEGVLLEGNPEMGYFMLGFDVPAGTALYAPFDGLTAAVTLEDYESDKSGSFKGLSFSAPDSLNGFSVYNVTGGAIGTVRSGDIFAEVASAKHIYPQYYGKVNLIMEFNLFDFEAAKYNEMQALFTEIFDHLCENGKGSS